MGRPRRCRRVFFNPRITHFKPAGVFLRDMENVILTRDELEAIRLIDFEKVGQSKAGKKMKISQPTLSRVLKSAREKLADAVINGKAIKIKGGDFEMIQQRGRGLGLGKGNVSGGRGRMGGMAAGPGGKCVCSKCGYREAQVRGSPCMNKKCPKCGSKMTRG